MFKNFGRDNHLVMLSLFIWALGEGLWFNLRQLYLADLGATPEQVGLALALEATARASLPILAGYLADRIGPYRVMLAAWVMGIVGPAVVALATTWQTVIPGLVAYALSGFALPAINAYVLASLPDDGLPGIADRALTGVVAAYPAGLIISPVLGGLLAERFGIRANLWIATLVFTLSTGVILFARHAEPGERTREHHPAALFRNRSFVLLAVYYLLATISLQVGYVLLPNFLKDTRGYSLETIGLLFSIFAAGMAVINLLAGRARQPWGLAGVLAACWLAVLILWQVGALIGVSVAFLALGGIFTARMLLMASTARVVEAQNRGLAFGFMETLTAVAAAIASWMAGTLYVMTPAHDLPLTAGLLGIPLALLLWLLLQSRLRPVTPVYEPVSPGD
jgi:MFS family permease